MRCPTRILSNACNQHLKMGHYSLPLFLCECPGKPHAWHLPTTILVRTQVHATPSPSACALYLVTDCFADQLQTQGHRRKAYAGDCSPMTTVLVSLPNCLAASCTACRGSLLTLRVTCALAASCTPMRPVPSGASAGLTGISKLSPFLSIVNVMTSFGCILQPQPNLNRQQCRALLIIQASTQYLSQDQEMYDATETVLRDVDHNIPYSPHHISNRQTHMNHHWSICFDPNKTVLACHPKLMRGYNTVPSLT